MAGGKKVSRQPNERQALPYQEWIGNWRRLLAIVAMAEVSRQAAELLIFGTARSTAAASFRG